MSRRLYCPCLALALFGGAAQAEPQVSNPASATIYLDGQAGDWVSEGLPSLQVTWTQGNSGVISTELSVWAQAAVVSLFTPVTSWQFAFAAPTNDPVHGIFGGAPPTVGFYGNAMRWPLERITEPGLSASGGGRGMNSLWGWFDVLEITLNADHTEFLSLAVDFQQWDSTLVPPDMVGPNLYGSIRVNSAVPIHLRPVPEIASGWMLLAGLLGVAARLGLLHRGFRRSG